MTTPTSKKTERESVLIEARAFAEEAIQTGFDRQTVAEALLYATRELLEAETGYEGTGYVFSPGAMEHC